MQQEAATPKRLGLARRLVLVMTLFGLIATACGGGASSTTTSAPESAAPIADLYEGEFEAFAGRQVDFAALEGEDVVFWFWAPW